MKIIILATMILLSSTLMAETIVCVAARGQEMKDAAFLVKSEGFQAIFLQGSKGDLLDNPNVFEGIPLTDVKLTSKGNGKSITAVGILMGQIRQKLQLVQVSQTKYKGINTIGQDMKIKLSCVRNDQIAIEPLR